MRLKQSVALSPDTIQRWAQLVQSWTPEERAAREKKFVRRIDFRLLPILLIMYIMNYIVRSEVQFEDLPKG